MLSVTLWMNEDGRRPLRAKTDPSEPGGHIDQPRRSAVPLLAGGTVLHCVPHYERGGAVAVTLLIRWRGKAGLNEQGESKKRPQGASSCC